MSHLSLVHRSGSRSGQRVIISSEKFIIGRSESCDFCLKSRTISRRHCAIIQHENVVVIVDLGSRNPTVVNGVALAKGKPKRLKDSDRVQIGRMSFTASLGENSNVDSGSDSSHQEGANRNQDVSPVASLLQELDELATSFGSGNGFDALFPPSTANTKSDVQANADQQKVEAPREGDNSTQEVTRETASNVESEDDDPQNSATIELPKELVEKPEPANDMTDADAEETGPRKLPDHLRPKGSASSQEAAYKALKDVFNRR